MIERLRVALFSYGAWFLALLFLFFPCAVFLIAYPERRYLSLLDYFFFLSVLVVPLSFLIGFKLKTQLGSWRSKLIPGWNAAHILLGIGLCAVLAASVMGIVGFSLRGNLEIGVGQHASVSGVLGLVCLEILLFVFVGYSKPILLAFMPMAFGFVAYKGSALNPLLSILIKNGHPQNVWMVLLVEFVGSSTLVWRMLQTYDERVEFQLSLFDYEGAQRRYWNSESPDRGLRKRLMTPTNRALDSIPHPLGKDLRSQIRHFQLGITVGQVGLRVPILMIPLFWILNRVSGHPLMDRNFLAFTIFPISTTFSQTVFAQRSIRQWMFMLPLRRAQIVLRYLSALFASVLKMWLGFFASVYVVEWMPFPGTIGALPSLRPFVESFAVLIPLFGILSLVVMRPSGDSLRRVIGGIAAGVILTLMIAFLISRTARIDDPAPIFSIAAFITGVGLIWYSYRCWLRADLD